MTLEKNNTPVSKATLYRTLEQMLDNHELIKYNIDGSPACYQYVECSKNPDHIHFKCEMCGKIIHIDNPEISSLDNELGYNKNFEFLLKQSKANYIMFSDHDDIWNKDKY